MTDVQTLFLVNMIVGAVLASCIALVGWGQDRALLRWALAFSLHTLTYLLLALRGVVPDFFSIVIANTLTSVMLALFAEELLRFQQRWPSRLLVWAPVGVLFLSFMVLMNAFEARVVVSALVFSVQAALIIAIILQGFASSVGRGKWIVVVAALISIVLFLQRGLNALIGDASLVDLQASTTMQTITFMGSAMALVMFAIGLLVMYKERAEHRSHTLALHDPLTQLGNRRLLKERLEAAFQNSALHRRFGGKLLLDLNRFKSLNDAHGHNVGDQLLVETARRLRECVNEDDTVVRLGGDEFVVLLEGLDVHKDKALEKAAVVARRIRDALARPFELTLAQPQGERLAYEASCSIGVALFVGQAIDAEELFRRADAAMYRAKQQQGGGIHLHDGASDMLTLVHSAAGVP